ncbi:MAG: GNVR domain-containing protein [Rubrivivax sp.]|nr:GNVR domain-containing protein [Rubrivivax sp.]
MADNVSRPRRDADSFDVRGAVRSIIDAAQLHRLLVIVVMLLTLLVVLLYMWVWPPVYRSDATIMGERDIDSSRDSFYTGWNVFRKDDHRTELELMVSGPVLAEVATKLKLSYDDVYHPFSSHLSYIWERSWVGSNYREFKAWLWPPEADAPKPEDLELGRIVVGLRAGISLEPVHEAIVGRLGVRGPNRRVAEVANAIVDTYLVQRTVRYQKEAQQALNVLNPEVERAAAELQDIEGRRVAFANQHGLSFDLQRENQEVKALTEMDQNMASTRVKVASLQAGLAELTSQLQREPATKKTATVYEADVIHESLRARRLDVQTTLLTMRNRYREDSPEIVELRSSLAQLDQMIGSSAQRIEKASTETLNTTQQQMEATANNLRAELASARASMAAMEQVTSSLRQRVANVPELQSTLRGFDRELLLATEKYNQLTIKRAQAMVSAVTTQAAIPSIRVVEYATPPSQKSWPKPKLMIPAALVVGLMLGVAVAQIKRFASGRVRRGFWGRRSGDALVYGVVAAATDWHPLSVTARPDAGATLSGGGVR